MENGRPEFNFIINQCIGFAAPPLFHTEEGSGFMEAFKDEMYSWMNDVWDDTTKEELLKNFEQNPKMFEKMAFSCLATILTEFLDCEED